MYTVNKTKLLREWGYLSFLWLTGLCEPIHEISSDLEFPVELWSAISWTYVTVGGDLNGATGNRTSSVFTEAVLMLSLCSWEWLLSLAHSGPSRPAWGGSHYGWGRGGMVKTHIPSWLLVDKMTAEARFSLVFTHLLSLLIFIYSFLSLLVSLFAWGYTNLGNIRESGVTFLKLRKKRMAGGPSIDEG